MKTWVIPKQCARIVVHFTCIRVSNSRRTPPGSVCVCVCVRTIPYPLLRVHTQQYRLSVGPEEWGCILVGRGEDREKDFIMGSKTAASNSGWLVVWNIKRLFPAIPRCRQSPRRAPSTALRGSLRSNDDRIYYNMCTYRYCL